jgi:hypothetical protein
MVVMLVGKVISVKPERPNAPLPIEVTLLGIVILVKPVQSPNAQSPIVVIVLGMLIPVIFVKPSKPLSAIPVTGQPVAVFGFVAGITMSVAVAVPLLTS